MIGMTKRWIVDDAGTLIDMETRDMFDIVEEVCPLLNELSEENEQLKDALNQRTEQCDKYYEENEHYKSIFFEIVETALTDKNCRELYCKGILNIFDKANSLNQAREMIKEHLK